MKTILRNTVASFLLLLLLPLQALALTTAQVNGLQAVATQTQLISTAVANSTQITPAQKTSLQGQLSLLQNTISSTLSSAGVTSQTAAVQSVRTNVLQVNITGDAKTYVAQAVVAYGPEPDPLNPSRMLPAATSTYNYNLAASTTLGARDFMKRLPELEKLVLASLSVSTQLPLSAFSRQSNLNVSFKRFANSSDVKKYTPYTFSKSFDLAGFIGTYSNIETIQITAGNNQFVARLLTDQSEDLTLVLYPSHSNKGGYNYLYTYESHGQVIESGQASDRTATQIKSELALYLQGSGAQFGVSDTVLVSELFDYMLQNTSTYDTSNISDRFVLSSSGFSIVSNPLYSQSHQAVKCYLKSARYESIIETLLTFYLAGMQFGNSIPNITYVAAAPVYSQGQSSMTACNLDSTTFFTKLP